MQPEPVTRMLYDCHFGSHGQTGPRLQATRKLGGPAATATVFVHMAMNALAD